MKWQAVCKTLGVKPLITGILLFAIAPFSVAETDSLQEMIGRANDHVAKFVEKFSDVKCTEHVTQEKFKADGKVELKEESTYDYLVILTNAGGEISLDESRLAVHEPRRDDHRDECGQKRSKRNDLFEGRHRTIDASRNEARA